MLIEKDDILKFYLNKNIPIKKNKEKINNNELIIPTYKNYENIININYNLTQLKKILKYYNLKITGNKDELKKICYNFLYHSYYTKILQIKFRNNLIKKYNLLYGPAFKKTKLCVNDVDFCTLDNINDINIYHLYTFKDDDNFIYGFDIQSIYNLYLKNNDKLENPFNTKLIDNKVFKNLLEIIRLSKILNIKIDLNYDKLDNFNETKKMDFRILQIFQKIDFLGNFTNLNWFNCLNKYNLIIFLKELIDIWNYRAMLSKEVKINICPPSGDPFKKSNLNMKIIYSYHFNVIKKNIINIMEELINKGINNQYKSLGASYILCSLTLVNSDAAEALPHLYWSVNHINNN